LNSDVIPLDFGKFFQYYSSDFVMKRGQLFIFEI